MKFYIRVFFENLSRKFKFYYNLPRITGPLHENIYDRIAPNFKMINISDKLVNKIKTRFVFKKFCPENCAVDNVEDYVNNQTGHR
jgi:hypothetical protein